MSNMGPIERLGDLVTATRDLTATRDAMSRTIDARDLLLKSDAMSRTIDARDLLLKSAKVAELEREQLPRRVVTLRHDDDVATALEVLARHNILSAPVVIVADTLDTRLPEDNEPLETLIGVFDVRDAVKALLDIIKPVTTMLSAMTEIEKVERVVADTHLIKVLGYDADLMYTPNAAATSVYDLIVKGFFGGDADRSTIVHRVVLFEADGALRRLISQTDVLQWLAEHDRKLTHSLETYTLRDLGFGSDARKREFVTVDASTPTIECYRKMREKQVSGAAVVSKDGRIIADITNGDLRTLTREHFSVLGLPVAEFIALTHGTSYSGYAASAPDDDAEGGFKSAFFEKSRAFRREQYEHERKRALAIDPRRTDLLSGVPPAGVFTVEIDSCFRYEWFSKLNKQRVYIVSKTSDAPFDVITLTDVLECATFGHAHRGTHRHR